LLDRGIGLSVSTTVYCCTVVSLQFAGQNVRTYCTDSTKFTFYHL